MKHLRIKNIGPVAEANMELKRFNFFIGPQCSGKSTIAKILSTCCWLEKECITTLNEHAIATGKEFVQLIEEFHKIKGYFCDSSFVEFETDSIKIEYADKILKVNFKDTACYRRPKICYIPAERNMVVLPELQQFDFGQNNLKSFLFDWFKAREYFVEDKKTDVLGLEVRYYYEPEQSRFKDQIINAEKTYQLALSAASSGLQSIIPLLITIKYYSEQYFLSYLKNLSYNLTDKNMKLQDDLMDSLVLEKLKSNFNHEERGNLLKNFLHNFKENKEYKLLYIQFAKAYKHLALPSKTYFVIEEPEQNLYPGTQMALLECIINLCQGKREHEFTMTTHSPYILNDLNLLFKRHDARDKDVIGLDWETVSVWGMENRGIKDLKLANAHLVDPDFLSSPLDKIYDEYAKYENVTGN